MLEKTRQFICQRQKLKEFVKYSLVGLLGAGLDLSFFNILIYIGGVDVYWAISLAFVCASGTVYFFHRKWTFRVKKNLALNLPSYLLAAFWGLSINYVVMIILIGQYEWWYNLAKVAALLVAYVWNYLTSRWWIFRVKRN